MERKSGVGLDSGTLYACMNAKSKSTCFCCCFEMSLMPVFEIVLPVLLCASGAYAEPPSDISHDCHSVLEESRVWGSRSPGVASPGTSGLTCCGKQTAFSFSGPGEGGHLLCLVKRTGSWFVRCPTEGVCLYALSLESPGLHSGVAGFAGCVSTAGAGCALSFPSFVKLMF